MYEAQSCDVSDGFSAVAQVGVHGGFGVDWSNGVPGLTIVSEEDWNTGRSSSELSSNVSFTKDDKSFERLSFSFLSFKSSVCSLEISRFNWKFCEETSASFFLVSIIVFFHFFCISINLFSSTENLPHCVFRCVLFTLQSCKNPRYLKCWWFNLSILNYKENFLLWETILCVLVIPNWWREPLLDLILQLWQKFNQYIPLYNKIKKKWKHSTKWSSIANMLIKFEILVLFITPFNRLNLHYPGVRSCKIVFMYMRGLITRKLISNFNGQVNFFNAYVVGQFPLCLAETYHVSSTIVFKAILTRKKTVTVRFNILW